MSQETSNSNSQEDSKTCNDTNASNTQETHDETENNEESTDASSDNESNESKDNGDLLTQILKPSQFQYGRPLISLIIMGEMCSMARSMGKLLNNIILKYNVVSRLRQFYYSTFDFDENSVALFWIEVSFTFVQLLSLYLVLICWIMIFVFFDCFFIV